MNHGTALNSKYNSDSNLTNEPEHNVPQYAREAARIASSGKEECNDPSESKPGRRAFFQTLACEGKPVDRAGQPLRLNDHNSSYHIARLDRMLAGLDGVLTILRAAEFARIDGFDIDDQLGDFIVDELHMAARELSIAASESLAKFREFAERQA